MELLLNSFLLGLTLFFISCVWHCAPVFLPVIYGSGDTVKSGIKTTLMFLSGRLTGYIIFGVIIGYIGSAISYQTIPYWLFPMLYLIAGIFLFVYSFGLYENHTLCIKINRYQKKGLFPAWIGLITGLNICPPFIVQIIPVIERGNAFWGAMAFLFFFLGSSLPLVLLLLFPFLTKRIKRISLKKTGMVLGISFSVVICARSLDNIINKPVFYEIDKESISRLTGNEIPEFDHIQLPPPYYYVKDGRGNQSYFFISTEVAPEIKGYTKEIVFALFFNSDGLISDIKIIQHSETPVYVNELFNPEGEFLRSYLDKNYNDDLSITPRLDIISGATVSASAVAGTIQKALPLIMSTHFNKEVTANDEYLFRFIKSAAYFSTILFLMIVLYQVFSFYIPEKRRQIKWLKYFNLCVNIIFLGLVFHNFISFADFIRIIIGDYPLMPENAGFYIRFFLVLIISVIWGRFYCQRICPFGAVLELFSRINIKRIIPESKVVKLARNIPYLIFIIALLVYIISSHKSDIFNVEPFSHLFIWHNNYIFWGFVLVILVVNVFIKRAWCHYTCPLGGVIRFIGSASISHNALKEIDDA